jgi:hypothetical protein
MASHLSPVPSPLAMTHSPSRTESLLSLLSKRCKTNGGPVLVFPSPNHGHSAAPLQIIRAALVQTVGLGELPTRWEQLIG